ncbi:MULTISPECIES: hypothetical protein [unclassified Streptomyces]|uniref:Rv3660c-like CheY-like N-terminal domain-containing protein n=1 Tax=Streptomyces sp. NBC_00060 TaxID=2975636 RepID=A0AAU2GT98_9ACTN
MSAPAHAAPDPPRQPVLIISDRLDHDPIGLLPCPVPLHHSPSAVFTREAYHKAPLVILDDRSYPHFLLRHMPHRPGLILAATDPDDATAYPRAAAIAAEAVLHAGQPLGWLHLRLHTATDFRHAHWDTLLTTPPPPQSS